MYLASALSIALLALAPVAASADQISASAHASGIVVSPSGIVRAIGAQVVSVESGIVQAVVTIGNAVLNVSLDTASSTKIAANGSLSATTSDIKAGDTVNFAGALTASTGSSLTIAATKIRDLTSFAFVHATSTLNKMGKHWGGIHLFGGFRLGKDD